jgi:FlaA1/EpsC-like NDP-sugar epimerase
VTPAVAAFLKRVLRFRWAAIAAIYAALIAAAYLVAYLLRFDFAIPPRYQQTFLMTLPLLVAIRLAGFYLMGVYRGIWRYASVGDLVTILKATTVTTLAFTALSAVVFELAVPRSVYVLDWVLCAGSVAGVRLLAILLRERRFRGGVWSARRRAVVVGAGDAAEMVLREFNRNLSSPYEAVALVDDDPSKLHTRIRGIEILGTIEDLPAVAAQSGAEEIIIAIPSATKAQMRRIFTICRGTGLTFRRVPPLSDLVQGVLKAAQLQEIRAEDLLDREPARIDLEPVRAQLAGRRVLITGAAGSIGSELARQVAALGPERLVLVDRAESNLYFMSLELRQRYPDLDLFAAVADILDGIRMAELCRDHRPEVVYHAAAYKHVPLMEENPLEAVANNVFGTEIVAREAARAGAAKVILISTDKAVEPVSVMGMTKRVAELVMQSMISDTTAFVAVRFGNVLGSDGSVLPLFKWQAAMRGQLAVTDPEASRYFMLPSEAALLVLEAGRIGGQGDIFFLNMGEPVRIIDLAHRLLARSGLEAGVDVDIAVTGLRPGERLKEILVDDREELESTEHDRILRVRSRLTREAFLEDFERLKQAVQLRERERMLETLRRMTSVY